VLGVGGRGRLRRRVAQVGVGEVAGVAGGLLAALGERAGLVAGLA